LFARGIAMSQIAPEFSRLVPLIRLGSEAFRQRIEATPEERESLSQRLDLIALDRLVAEVELRRESAEFLLEAAYEAEFVQSCAVTLEPVRGTISDRFSLVYGPVQDDEAQEIALTGDEPAFEPLTGDTIDIGEAVAQELSLALPIFPRDPEASIEDVVAAEPMEAPLAALARLRKRMEC
jgi:uncharacterized metal-binding protein YceD (DUF177 family)